MERVANKEENMYIGALRVTGEFRNGQWVVTLRFSPKRENRIEAQRTIVMGSGERAEHMSSVVCRVGKEVWSKILDRAAGREPAACEWSKSWLDEVVAEALCTVGWEVGRKRNAAPASFRNFPSWGLGSQAVRELNDIGNTEIAAPPLLEKLVTELEQDMRKPQFEARREQMRKYASDSTSAVSIKPWAKLGLRDTLLRQLKRTPQTRGKPVPRLRPMACYIRDDMNEALVEADLRNVVGTITDHLAEVVYGPQWDELGLVKTAVLIFEPEQLHSTEVSMPSKTRFLPPVLARIDLNVVRDVYELGQNIQCKGKDGFHEMLRVTSGVCGEVFPFLKETSVSYIHISTACCL
jgi:hypothetical protein